MTSKSPTAEEVLGLYLSHLAAITKHRESQGEDAIARWDELMQATSQLDSAITRWQASQGPVTREWFVERFGTNDVKTRSGLGVKHSGSSVPWIYFTDFDGDTRLNQPLVNPTRSDIETLVRVLGGEACI